MPEAAPVIALAISLSTAHRAILDALVQAVARAGFSALSGAAIMLIPLIAESGSHAITLAEKSGQTRQGVGQILHDLEARGLVNIVPDPEDDRSRLNHLTLRGLALRDAILKAAADIEAVTGREAIGSLLESLAPVARIFMQETAEE